MKTALPLTALVAALLAWTPAARSHCEVPCGIYDDAARIKQIAENITTVEKAINQITALSAAEPKNFNQIVRWVNTKETHATEIQHIVSQYFMTQRIKPVDPADKAKTAKYVHELTLLHHLLVYAMKAKQTTDLENVKTLRKLLAEFEASYLGKTSTAAAHAHGPDGQHTH